MAVPTNWLTLPMVWAVGDASPYTLVYVTFGCGTARAPFPTIGSSHLVVFLRTANGRPYKLVNVTYGVGYNSDF